MSKALYLENEFSTRAIDRYGITLFEPSDAKELIQEAERRKIRILGIDSFKIENETIQPQMEHSIDYSSRNYFSEDDWSASIQFIRSKESTGLLFEITLGDVIDIKNTKSEQGESLNSDQLRRSS